MKIIFLDIDGVLNDHKQFNATRCCGIHPMCAERFNQLLRACPSAEIVLISAWRYLIIGGDMTLKGFEYLLQTHGVDAVGRIIGITEKDSKMPDFDAGDEDSETHIWTWGIDERARQIKAAIEKHAPESWVILDDLPLGMPRHVETDQDSGLSDEDVRQALKHLDCIDSPQPPYTAKGGKR